MKTLNDIKTYSELLSLSTYNDRLDYLRLNNKVGKETFGFDRYVNQVFYSSDIWKKVRREIIIRDNGCDLGIDDYVISGFIYVHHMNPISLEDIINRSEYLLNPEYLISASDLTHRAIHYNASILPEYEIVNRKPNDTCPWRRSVKNG